MMLLPPGWTVMDTCLAAGAPGPSRSPDAADTGSPGIGIDGDRQVRAGVGDLDTESLVSEFGRESGDSAAVPDGVGHQFRRDKQRVGHDHVGCQSLADQPAEL